MKRFAIIAVCLLMLSAFYGSASAFPTYFTQFTTTYPTSGTASFACGICHVNAQNPGARNPYGLAFAGAGHAFAPIESQDSDGDGFTNITEINAGTNPGDPASHPAPVPVTCTSFTYSDFGACQSDGTQTRTVLTSSPAGCTGGSPALTQSCTFVPPPSGNTSVTVNAARGSGQITVETMTGGTNLTNVSAVSDADGSINQANKPSGFVFNNGLVTFKVNGVATGGTVQVKLTFPSAFASGSKVYKTRADGFHEYTNAVVSGNTVTLTLTDGGAGDSDGAANGTITDPVGIASPVPTSTEEEGGGGCSIGRHQSGPTAVADAAVILAPLFVVGLVMAIRRRKK